MTRSLLFPGLLATALLLPSWSALGVPVATAEVEAMLAGTTTTDTDPGPTSALAELVDPGPFDEWATRAAANANGNLGVRSEFFGAGGTFATLRSGATWSDSVNATDGATISFDFTIPGAAIGFDANNVGGLSGGVFVEVLFNGTQVFVTSADVRTLANSPVGVGDYELDKGGTVELSETFSSGVVPAVVGPGAGFLFGELSQSLSLAAVAGVNTIEYRMSAFVDGLIGETSALAVIGDPLNLSQSGPGVALTVGPGGIVLFEPAVELLLLTGLAGALRRRSRYQRSRVARDRAREV